MDPLAVLGHIVYTVVPERCESAKSDTVRDFYKHALTDPESYIQECKGSIATWVLEGAATETLRDPVKYVSCSHYSYHPQHPLRPFPVVAYLFARVNTNTNTNADMLQIERACCHQLST
jgi:hypothetical protein